jgi:hypothetical protein
MTTATVYPPIFFQHRLMEVMPALQLFLCLWQVDANPIWVKWQSAARYVQAHKSIVIPHLHFATTRGSKSVGRQEPCIWTRFSPDEFEELENYRRMQSRIPPIAEAVRTLVSLGLQAANKGRAA